MMCWAPSTLPAGFDAPVREAGRRSCSYTDEVPSTSFSRHSRGDVMLSRLLCSAMVLSACVVPVERPSVSADPWAPIGSGKLCVDRGSTRIDGQHHTVEWVQESCRGAPFLPLQRMTFRCQRQSSADAWVFDVYRYDTATSNSALYSTGTDTVQALESILDDPW